MQWFWNGVAATAHWRAEQAERRADRSFRRGKAERRRSDDWAMIQQWADWLEPGRKAWAAFKRLCGIGRR
jgi:hypothetical protein